jgi:hypothetical protein
VRLLEFHRYGEVIVAIVFNVVAFDVVLFATNKIHPVTHGLLVLVRDPVLAPVSPVGLSDNLRSGLDGVCGVESGGIELESAAVITGDVESVLSSLRGLEVALEEISESVVLVTKSFERGVDGGGLGLAAIDQISPGRGLVFGWTDLSSLDTVSTRLGSSGKGFRSLDTSDTCDFLVSGCLDLTVDTINLHSLCARVEALTYYLQCLTTRGFTSILAD